MKPRNVSTGGHLSDDDLFEFLPKKRLVKIVVCGSSEFQVLSVCEQETVRNRAQAIAFHVLRLLCPLLHPGNNLCTAEEEQHPG